MSGDEAMGHFLHGMLNPDPQPGPPYVHTFSPSQPEAVIERLGWGWWSVRIEHDLTSTRGWICLGRRNAESKARRELRKCRHVPYSYRITG